jgi:putative glycerol-1-phosphate prenyltransferase
LAKNVSLLSTIIEKKKTGQKSLAVLIDPDRVESPDHLLDLLAVINESEADLLFYGGSLITESKDFDSLGMIKKASNLPVVLFPSSPSQIRKEADAILFLSLISGRNPEFLIGHHVTAAPILKASNLEILPVGYMLVGGSRQTTAGYISNTSPIPPNKPEIAAATAMAGEMLGMRLLYLDAGSGADYPVSTEMIEAVKTHTDTPLIVGGGIRSVDTAARAYRAGADVLVVGTAIEEDPDLLGELSGIKSLEL